MCMLANALSTATAYPRVQWEMAVPLVSGVGFDRVHLSRIQ